MTAWMSASARMTRGGEAMSVQTQSSGTRCGGCGRQYSASTWRELSQVRMLTRHEVGAYVSVWPEDAVIDVRSCRGCGRAMARKR
jgi:hypothetical protein